MVLLSRGRLALDALFVLVVRVIDTVDVHAALVRSDPPAGAVLPEAPATIRLRFTEPLEPRFTRAEVLDAIGASVSGARVVVFAEMPGMGGDAQGIAAGRRKSGAIEWKTCRCAWPNPGK